MLGHGAKFGHKKEQAIAALLSHRNVEAAARAVGISSNTLLRWTKEPEVDAADRGARGAACAAPPIDRAATRCFRRCRDDCVEDHAGLESVGRNSLAGRRDCPGP